MRYRHYKGGLYETLCEDATLEATGERAVVYRAEATGGIWVRTHADFFAVVPGHGPRFAPLEPDAPRQAPPR